jgi:hypothetical protein
MRPHGRRIGYPKGAHVGFLDKLKQQATEVATTVAEKTQETAKMGQLQVQLRNLRNEERDALADFGRAAYTLHQEGALAERSGELAAAGAKIADVRRQIADKEAEIADVRGANGEDGAASDTVESSAEEVRADPPPQSPPSEG